MRRDGFALAGAGVVMMKELADNLSSVRMRLLEVLVFVAGAGAVYATIGEVRSVVSEDPFVFLRLFTTAQGAAAVVRRLSRLPHSDRRHRARLRQRQQRVQPPHDEPPAGAADLSRRAAVRKVPRRPGDAGDHADGAVAVRHRPRRAAARPAAERRGGVCAASPSCWRRSPTAASGWRWRCCSRSCSARRRRRRWRRCRSGCCSPSSGRCWCR